MAAKNTQNKNVVKVVEQEEKQKALKTAMDQIEKQFGKGAVMRLGQNTEMNVEAISTGSLTLDQATGIGGLPRPEGRHGRVPDMPGRDEVRLADAQGDGPLHGVGQIEEPPDGGRLDSLCPLGDQGVDVHGLTTMRLSPGSFSKMTPSVL